MTKSETRKKQREERYKEIQKERKEREESKMKRGHLKIIFGDYEDVLI